MPGDAALALACVVLMAALFCFLILRHAPLAALAALAPLPGVWFARSWNADILSAYGFGLSVAALAAAGLSRARRDDRSIGQADMVMAVYGGVLVMLLRDWRLGLAFGAAALSASLVPLLGRFFLFDEEFIARANRLHERSMPCVAHLFTQSGNPCLDPQLVLAGLDGQALDPGRGRAVIK